MTKMLTKEFARELLKAMGCPGDQCQSVTINTDIDNLVTVDIRYSVDPEWLKKASEAMIKDD